MIDVVVTYYDYDYIVDDVNNNKRSTVCIFMIAGLCFQKGGWNNRSLFNIIISL